MKVRSILFVLGFVLCSFAVSAQVQFDAKVSKSTLGINERLRVDFEMNQDGDNFKPPSFENFRVVGGPNQSISNSWVNGKRSFSKTYSYFLSPQKRGKITIGQATIEIKGEIYKTSPVAVEITTAVETPKDGSNPDYLASENVHLVAEVSNSTPYLNEAITVVYKLYVSHQVSITSQWREIDSPKYADFWSQNIDNQNNFKVQEGKYQGRDYRYVVLKTTILYPQKTGELDIEPLTLDIPIDVKGNRRDFFGRPVMERVNRTVSAGKRTIEVRPLPSEGRPADFNGAVGDFNFDVSTNKTALNANESLQMDIKVSGRGNLKLFNLPKLKLPSSLEVYEPEHQEKVSTDLRGMNGYISDSYTVVPQFKGSYPINALSFSFFNPRTEKYKTITSENFIIDVESGPISSSPSSDPQGQEKQVVMAKDQFKYIKLDTNLSSITQEPFFKSALFWSLVGGPLLLIPIFIVVGKKRKERLEDIEGNKLRNANRLSKRYLSEARKNMDRPDAFYESLERALHNYLKAKLNIETSEMSKTRISELLIARNVEASVKEDFVNMLESCEFARYATYSSDSVEQDYKKATEVISNMDKQIQ